MLAVSESEKLIQKSSLRRSFRANTTGRQKTFKIDLLNQNHMKLLDSMSKQGFVKLWIGLENGTKIFVKWNISNHCELVMRSLVECSKEATFWFMFLILMLFHFHNVPINFHNGSIHFHNPLWTFSSVRLVAQLGKWFRNEIEVRTTL